MSVRLSARARPASASRRTQFPQHGRIQPCRAQASIPTKANTLDKGPYILDKATRGFSTLVKVFSTREWTGSSTHITQVKKGLKIRVYDRHFFQCPAEVGRGWRHGCPPTATSGKQVRGLSFPFQQSEIQNMQEEYPYCQTSSVVVAWFLP